MVEHSPVQRRALIVEDETLFAMSLAVDMQALGFSTCELAAKGPRRIFEGNGGSADIVLMDVNLEGGREGIEAARWLREVCDIPVPSETISARSDGEVRLAHH
jgi:DNA-binding response OmpR family regulator